ncbi:hypothetical protein [Morganella morganii]|uniref:hypothetical protein n=1 Tax=Morganella morganii TaxID=582 RepID=UPI00301BF796
MKNRILIVTTLFLSSVSPAGLANDVRVSVTHPQTVRSAPVITLPGKFVAKNEIAIGSPLQQQTVTAVFAALKASDAIGFAIVAITLTIVAVSLPVSFIGGLSANILCRSE